MYMIRLDDASEHMHVDNWNRMEQLLDRNSVKPLVGIIPNNRDSMFLQFPRALDFWKNACNWQFKGWRIALHGYEHIYSTNCSGINPVHNHSEFAGHTLDVQRQKIRDGLNILTEKGLNPTVFFAPSHTFDENTLEALRLESNIRIISDTAANDIYCRNGFTFIPQQTGRVRKLPFRLTTICLHPNFMTDAEFSEVDTFISENQTKFIDPNSIAETTRRKDILDLFIEKMYFLKRSIRK